MTQEEKQLLIQDICARLPYGVIIQYKQKTFAPYSEYTVDTKVEMDEMLQHRLKLLDFKPYLRPTSSITNDEKETYESFVIGIATNDTGAWELTDWLNKKMFDYRGLILMGLALEAPEGMYETE